jgi:hypothetical protein
MDGTMIQRNQELRIKMATDIANSLNKGEIPQHLKNSRLIPLSKRKSSSIASLQEVRTIAVSSHILKIFEQSILNKLQETQSQLLKTRNYQSGFKNGVGVHRNIAKLL